MSDRGVPSGGVPPPKPGIEIDRTRRPDLADGEGDPGPADQVYDVEFDDGDDLARRRIIEKIPVEIP